MRNALIQSAAAGAILLFTLVACADQQGKIVGASESSYQINLGTNHGLKDGDTLLVFANSTSTTSLGFVSVIRARETSCTCAGSGPFKAGYIVRTPSQVPKSKADRLSPKADAAQDSVNAKGKASAEYREGKDFPLAKGIDARLTDAENYVLVEKAKDFSRPVPTELTAEDRELARILSMPADRGPTMPMPVYHHRSSRILDILSGALATKGLDFASKKCRNIPVFGNYFAAHLENGRDAMLDATLQASDPNMDDEDRDIVRRLISARMDHKPLDQVITEKMVDDQLNELAKRDPQAAARCRGILFAMRAGGLAN